MECIVHFRVVHEQETKELRGLILVEQGSQPSVQQIIAMLGHMGYEVRQDSADELVFRPADGGADYRYIRITELDTGEEVYREDRHLRTLLENLLPRH
ncbi:hypothetical protein [Paenibacillus medicaginis]|uniref:Uncharacterized protein n=1 Tax=Paenibacillus medicaginis TaxID=1470560 RepID=A0ABV5C4E9_9BACL